jgi:hypothetical protein
MNEQIIIPDFLPAMIQDFPGNDYQKNEAEIDEIIGYIPPNTDVKKLKGRIFPPSWNAGLIGVQKHTPETRLKISGIVKNISPETRKRMSQARKGIHAGDKNPMYGKAPWNKGLKLSQKPPKEPRAKKIKPPKILKGKAIGERHHKNTTSEATARQIKLDLKNGMRICDIVRKHGVTKSVISNIKHGYSWKWL